MMSLVIAEADAEVCMLGRRYTGPSIRRILCQKDARAQTSTGARGKSRGRTARGRGGQKRRNVPRLAASCVRGGRNQPLRITF